MLIGNCKTLRNLNEKNYPSLFCYCFSNYFKSVLVVFLQRTLIEFHSSYFFEKIKKNYDKPIFSKTKAKYKKKKQKKNTFLYKIYVQPPNFYYENRTSSIREAGYFNFMIYSMCHPTRRFVMSKLAVNNIFPHSCIGFQTIRHFVTNTQRELA